MQVLYERCAAVDVGKDVIAVAVRVPGVRGGRKTEKRTYKTFYGVLREMARWLASQCVTHVAMEATGSYSMPVYHALVEHGSFERVLVCNAGHVKNVPGRKTDLADAEWLAQLLESGLLAGSFIPRPASRRSGTSSGTGRRSPSSGSARSPGSATCCRTRASRSTRSPRVSRQKVGSLFN